MTGPLHLAAWSALVAAACGERRPIRPDAGAADAPAVDAAVEDAAIDAPPAGPAMLELGGAIAPIHDPTLIAVDGFYYLFATGTGIRIHTSLDLMSWSLGGQVFETKPAWITTTDPGNPNNLWAPDISSFNGRFHLYYSASRFGVNASCIGHASAAAITGPWDDHGAVICSSASDNWNAIDPVLVLDAADEPWLAFGSFWSGLKLIRLDADGARADSQMFALATRPSTAVEAPYIIRRGGFYYLFQSIDSCCQGAASTYKILVGRATDIRGPYVDADGVALLAGGGTLLVEGDERWRGPGHNAILQTPTRDLNVFHAYDADAGGIPTLRIGELRWTDDGWPISAGP